MSTVWKAARWSLALALLIWFALGVNAWSYFAKSGMKGVYFSAVHAVDVVRLPPTSPIPEIPGNFRALSVRELEELTKGGRLKYIHADRRELRHYDRFTGPNEYRSAASIGPQLDIFHGRYVLDGNRVCALPKSHSSGACYRLYTNEDDGLFRYVHPYQEFQGEWQAIERDGSEA